MPVGDPRFGKLFRCPNNPVEMDTSRQETLRRISNMEAFADKTFDNFEIRFGMYTLQEEASLQAAYETAQDFAREPGGWLLLEGTYGCGKTHLAAAVGNVRLQQGDVVLFITTPDLLDHLRSAYGPTSEVGYDETFERVRNAEVLILDDLGVENPSPWAQEKLFQLLNHRYVHEMPTVITTNADIDRLDQRIRSRLLDVNLIHRVRIAAPDYRSSIQNAREPMLWDLSLYQEMTFDSFDINSTRLADEQQNLRRVLQASKAYAEDSRGYWLILMGDYGTGKTHLAAAIAQYRQEQGEKIAFLTVPDLLDYLRTTLDANTPASFGQRFQAVRNAPFLVLDDLGSGTPSNWAKEKLFQILDYRYLTRLPTVITTAKNIDNLDARIRSRVLDERRCIMFALEARPYAYRMKQKRP